MLRLQLGQPAQPLFPLIIRARLAASGHSRRSRRQITGQGLGQGQVIRVTGLFRVSGLQLLGIRWGRLRPNRHFTPTANGTLFNSQSLKTANTKLGERSVSV
jgi:hypothetical protein